MRRALLLLTASVTLLTAVPAHAQSRKDAVIRQLSSDGYSHFTVRRTWLGFDQIIARGPAGRREIVLNPSTGAIMRDYLYPGDSAADAPAPETDAPVSRPLDPVATASPAATPAASPDSDLPPSASDRASPPGLSDRDAPPGQSRDKNDNPGRDRDKNDNRGRDRDRDDDPGRDR